MPHNRRPATTTRTASAATDDNMKSTLKMASSLGAARSLLLGWCLLQTIVVVADAAGVNESSCRTSAEPSDPARQSESAGGDDELGNDGEGQTVGAQSACLAGRVLRNLGEGTHHDHEDANDPVLFSFFLGFFQNEHHVGSGDDGDAAAVVSSSRTKRAGEVPHLKISPDSFKAQAGKPFVLSCLGAGGDGALFADLTWYNPSGEKIVSGGKISVDTTNSGATLMLSFRDPSPNDAGTYSCKGTFQNSEKLESTISLSIFEGVSFKDCPEVQALVKGNEQSAVRCTASANPRADISWFKDDSQLDTQRYVIDNNGVRLRSTVAEMDGGTYIVRAVVMETGQFLEKTISVEIHTKPEIIDLNREYELIDGEEASITCVAAATPHSLYTWFDNRKRNLSEVDGFRVQRNSGELLIKKVDKDMDGDFVCIAENAAGRDEKATSINIITKPVITSLENVSEAEGQQAILVCKARGNPTPTLSIRREGLGQEPLRDSQNRISLQQHEVKGEVTLTLRLSELHQTDDGLYYCAAENKAGKDDRVGHLQVQYKPDMSRNPTVVKTWSGHIKNITCLASAIPNASISWFNNNLEIRDDAIYRVYGGNNGRSVLQVNPASGRGVYREYKCEAYNRHGRASHYVTLAEAFPPGPIEQANVIKLSPQSVTFAFEGPNSDGGLPLIRYHVTYHETIRGAINEGMNKSWPAGTGPYVLEGGLKPNAQYLFKFAAENEAGIGPSAADLPLVLPNESQPESPTIIRDDPLKEALSGDILSQFSHRYLLRWSEPHSNGREIENYEIKYYLVHRGERGEWIQEGPGKMESVVASDDLQYKLERLSPSTFYKVELSAKNALGNSLPSHLVFKTADFADGDEEVLVKSETTQEERSPDILISPSSFDLIIWILIASTTAFIVIIDLVCCISYSKGLAYCLCVRRCGTASTANTEQNMKPAKESAV